ncbi:hypothetical protein QQF64_024353 [Cirrhinus molitorella]|uniref:Uncharacterized protein n=1 Tax=Cirrhinus molitorella TaxID=172907 RepID=A0ABR3NKZ4_9TELE
MTAVGDEIVKHPDRGGGEELIGKFKATATTENRHFVNSRAGSAVCGLRRSLCNQHFVLNRFPPSFCLFAWLQPSLALWWFTTQYVNSNSQR